MEAGLPLYGHELDRATSPLEAGLNTFVKLGREFVGAAALDAQQRDGLKRRLVGIRTEDGRSVARQGYKLFVGAREVGVMTSGTFAPSFNRPLGMAYRGGGGRRAGLLSKWRFAIAGSAPRLWDCRFTAAASRPRRIIVQQSSINRRSTYFTMRFFPHTESDIRAMLDTIGAPSSTI